MIHWEGNDILDGGRHVLEKGSFEVRLKGKKESCKEPHWEKSFQAE